jgi:uncharacterized protein YciW
MSMTASQMTLLTQAGITSQSSLSSVVAARENIIELTQAAEVAVLKPKDYGPFGHDLRAALAARVATSAGDETLAAYYLTDAGAYSALAISDASEDLIASNQQLPVILAFVDKVANQTRAVSAEDISGLQTAGISDPDIVRLCELVAFLAYQIRVISGLKLIQGVQS